MCNTQDSGNCDALFPEQIVEQWCAGCKFKDRYEALLLQVRSIGVTVGSSEHKQIKAILKEYGEQ